MEQTASSSWRNQVQPIPGFLQPSGTASAVPTSPSVPLSPTGAATAASASLSSRPLRAPRIPRPTPPPLPPVTPPVPTVPPVPMVPSASPTVSFHKTSFILLMLGMIALVLLSFVVGFLVGARTFLPPSTPKEERRQERGALGAEGASKSSWHIPSETTLASWGVTEPFALQQVEGRLPPGASMALHQTVEQGREKLNQTLAAGGQTTTAMPTASLSGAQVFSPSQGAPPLPRGVVYTLQVGSFHAVDPALKTADAYRQQGYPAYVVKAWGAEGRLWYYVRIGQYGGQKEANDQAMKMIQQHHISAMVVEQKSTDIKM